MFDTLPYNLYHSYRRIMKCNYDFIHNRGIIEMTDLIGKRVRINNTCPYEDCRGLNGNVTAKIPWAENRWDVTVTLGDRTTNFFLKEEWFDIIAGDNMEKSPQDSLTELQKLCTTNNIHILISKRDYQIWDEYSDDTYEMNNVDDVMKAIECLNELKQWRQ